MKSFSLFTKIITPILIVGVLFSYIGFLYLHSVLETTIKHEIDEKIDNKIHTMQNFLESEFKMLFYLYGNSKSDYDEQTKITKQEILRQLKNEMKTTSDILYVIDPNQYEQLSKDGLLPSELARIIRENKNYFSIGEISYKVEHFYFKPWDWSIIYSTFAPKTKQFSSNIP